MEQGISTNWIGRVLSSSFPAIFVILTLIMGAVALLLTPREEDPQIVVPMADVVIAAPGLSAKQVAHQVTEPLERILSQIDGVEYVYSQSNRDGALVTVRFYVGESRTDSLVKLYNKLYSNQDKIPQAVSHWAVKPVEIDDVPMVVAALYSTDENLYGYAELRRLAEQAKQRLKAIKHTNSVEIVGGQSRVIEVQLDSVALAAYHTSMDDIARAIQVSNQEQTGGAVYQDGYRLQVQSGLYLQSAQELSQLVVNVINGQPVYLQDVADVQDAFTHAQETTYFYPGVAYHFGDDQADASVHAAHEQYYQDAQYPAVFLSVAKQKGSNAVWVADDVLAALAELQADLLPQEVQVDIIRNYGETADEKVSELVSSLVVATVIVIIFIGVFLNWRAAAVVAIAIPISYGATLGMDLLFGYTINRVTLFALILALGLIVDDPIVAIDNMERHMKQSGKKTKSILVTAMTEIRGALLMSTLAIVIVFMPMFFITGMMGPYMGPMAFNVPMAVVFSMITAFFVTPWLAWKIMKVSSDAGVYQPETTLLYRGYKKLLGGLMKTKKRSTLFLWGVGVLFVLTAALPAFRLVPLKLLPHDNKSELQLVVDMPEGTPLERTEAAMHTLARYVQRVPEVKSISTFSGTASPMDFNGMVRHYFRRSEPYHADARILLVDKHQRNMQSNEIATRLRDELQEIASQLGVKRFQIVQMPPGPPVMSTLVAEVYGTTAHSYEELEQAAQVVASRLKQELHVHEVATSVPEVHDVYRFIPDREKAALSGISVQDIQRTIHAASHGYVVDYLQIETELQPLPIEIRLPEQQRESLHALEALSVRGQPGFARQEQGQGLTDAPAPLVALTELGRFEQQEADRPIFHKNLQPLVYVFGDVTGRVPADVVVDMMADQGKALAVPKQVRSLASRTYFSNGAGLGWDVQEGIDVVWSGEGEWKITLDVFRDLGLAYVVALLGVYLVMVLQTGLKGVSGIMMLSIPLTVIGIMPGFWFLNMFQTDIGQYPNPSLFTATAMIGMIALAGIVVRNALILIEFIQQKLVTGASLEQSLFEAGAARTRPILLTAGTTMLGNIVITLDPIFSGLAWAIIFGITASTLFTLVVVPLVYYLMYKQVAGYGLPPEMMYQRAQAISNKT